MTGTPPASRVQRVRHETKLREVRVVRVNDVTPHFRSITFAGDALADFDSASFDDHIKFIFGGDDGEVVKRDYTPRIFDREARELTIEFALHAEGRAAQWASRVLPGQSARIGGPKSSFIVPLDYDWHFLAGDETALPAIARRLEELPPTTRAIVLMQASDPADRRALHTAAELSVHWVPDAEQFLGAARALQLPVGDGYVWCAGEASVMVKMRKFMLEEKQLRPEAMRISSYWKLGAAAHHAVIDG
ncbi:MAG: siderophore-interacting protein [Pseudomonadota bacterium]